MEKAIEETLEKSIVQAVKTALDSWNLKSDIEKKVSEQVSRIVKEIGFTAYNGFIAEKIKQITEGICREDISKKIQEVFDNILITKRENIKLSEICDAYREYVCNEVDEEEKYNFEHFYVSIERADPPFNWLTFKFAESKPEGRFSHAEKTIEFTVHQTDKEHREIGWIGSVRIEGYDLEKKINFGSMSSIEQLLINISYNKTPIIIDVESEDDIDNSYDVDI